MSTHDNLHLLLGAYVLGGLSDADHHTFSEHLRGCAACQQELGQVSGLPRLLGLVDFATPPSDTEGYAAQPAPRDTLAPSGAGSRDVTGSAPAGAATPGADAAGADPAGHRPEPLDDLLAAVRRRRSRRRTWTAVAGTAAAAGLVASGVWLGPRLTAEPERPTRHLVATSTSSPAAIDIALVTRGWGTQVDLDCKDMPVGVDLVLYVVDAEGKATPVASWKGTKSGYSRITGATSLQPTEIRRLDVRTASGDVLASART